MGFLDSFTGKAQRRDIVAAQGKASAALDKGYADSMGRYDQAADLYDPYAQQGTKANDFYYNALGLNGGEAQTGAIDTLTGNPLFQGQLGNDSNALAKLLNARGASGGGLANIAAQRVFQQTAGNWLDRYRDAGQQGFQATGAQANIRAGQGDAAYGYGATKAGNQINYGNALAETRGIGVNNLLNIVGTGIKGYNALYNGGRT